MPDRSYIKKKALQSVKWHQASFPEVVETVFRRFWSYEEEYGVVKRDSANAFEYLKKMGAISRLSHMVTWALILRALIMSSFRTARW